MRVNHRKPNVVVVVAQVVLRVSRHTDVAYGGLEAMDTVPRLLNDAIFKNLHGARSAYHLERKTTVVVFGQNMTKQKSTQTLACVLCVVVSSGVTLMPMHQIQ